VPKISVIIPSYNCAEFVPGAVESVLLQSLRDYELIVVDDGSSDNTRQVLSPYFGQIPFQYIRQENRGLPGARNSGVRASGSEYLAFLDADDALAPNALELMTAALDASGASWCMIDIVKVRGPLREIRRTVIPAGDRFLGILKEDFPCRAMFFRRKDFLDVGMYDEDIRYREDWDLNIRMFGAGKPFIYIDQPLYLYTWREDSMTTGNRAGMLAYTERILKKHHKRLADAGAAPATTIYAHNTWRLARRYSYATKNYGGALKCVTDSLGYDFNLRRLFHLVVYGSKRQPAKLSVPWM